MFTDIHRDFGEVEGDGAGVTHHAGSDPDRLKLPDPDPDLRNRCAIVTAPTSEPRHPGSSGARCRCVIGVFVTKVVKCTGFSLGCIQG